jgi:hypothetical protein
MKQLVCVFQILGRVKCYCGFDIKAQHYHSLITLPYHPLVVYLSTHKKLR